MTCKPYTSREIFPYTHGKETITGGGKDRVREGGGREREKERERERVGRERGRKKDRGGREGGREREREREKVKRKKIEKGEIFFFC